jgi:hypothetical protein
MANALKMAIVESIFSLHALGWKQRRIARELGIDRETVRKYLRQRLCAAKPANAPTGSDQPKPATSGGLPGLEAKPANAPIGTAEGGGATPADAPTGGPAQAADPQPAAAAVEAERGHPCEAVTDSCVNPEENASFWRRSQSSRQHPRAEGWPAAMRVDRKTPYFTARTWSQADFGQN